MVVVLVSHVKNVKRNGFFLLELVVVVMISMVLLSSFFVSVRQYRSLSLRVTALYQAQVLSLARYSALLYDTSAVVSLEAQSLMWSIGDRLEEEVPVPDYIQLAINGRGKLGYTETGMTRYAGTLTLTSDHLVKKVRLGVGTGRVRW